MWWEMIGDDEGGASGDLRPSYRRAFIALVALFTVVGPCCVSGMRAVSAAWLHDAVDVGTDH